MIRTPIVFIGTSDLAGLFRGKAVPEARLNSDGFAGVGWVPTNAMITAFDSIGDTQYGALGDLLIVPDMSTDTCVDFGDGGVAERFVIGYVRTMSGDPFACCTRAHLKHALARLKKVSGLYLQSAFEHEFQLSGLADTGRQIPSFSMHGHRAALEFGETLLAALQQAGVQPESFIKEYGEDQYEVPVAVACGIAAADQAVIFREVVHATARHYNRVASFNPLRSTTGVGNGVHVHFSFLDGDDKPVTFDPDGQHGLSAVAGSFVAGILKYLPEMLCLCAPLATSFLRLSPHRWSAAYNNLGDQDREASLRICPAPVNDEQARARRFNVEFRAADAAASPYLVLAAIVHAGTQGIEEKLPTPVATTEDLSLLDDHTLRSRGFVRLPQSLEDALEAFANSDIANVWFGNEFKTAYLDHKRAELVHLQPLSDDERCEAYGQIY